MNLLQMCQGLDNSLLELEMARRGAHDGAAINERNQQWLAELASLQRAKLGRDWLQFVIDKDAPYNNQIIETAQLAEEAANRLEENSNVECLTEGDLWIRLLQTTNTTAKTLFDLVKLNWIDEISIFHKLTPYNQLRSTASILPQNLSPLNDYETNYKIAERLSKQDSPKTEQDITQFKQSVKNCIDAAAKLCFDAPDEVIEFFRAVNTGGASLNLVTPVVLTWLKDNDQLLKYIVRGNGR
jgi:hypothetical protein